MRSVGYINKFDFSKRVIFDRQGGKHDILIFYRKPEERCEKWSNGQS